MSNWWSILGVRLAILWSLIRLVHVAHYRQWYFPFTGMPGTKVPAGAQWMTGGCSEISLEISSTEPVVKRPDYRLVSGEVLTPVRQKTQSKDWANETATERPPTRVLLKFFWWLSRNVTQRHAIFCPRNILNTFWHLVIHHRFKAIFQPTSWSELKSESEPSLF